jgi:phosphatidylglycerol:prolipoprotein diacylglycerol transferase
VWPTLVKIGPLELGTFGLMAALGFIAAYAVFRGELKRRRLNVKLAPDVLLAGVAGGLIGARLNFALEYWEVTLADPVAVLFSRYGFTWYGGALGGALAVIILLKVKKEKLGRYADAVAPALALGYVFGRAGCQLAGDGDYGVASNLPWAMSYPRGVVPTLERVHPTPIYEMILFLAIFFVLLRLARLDRPPWWLFALYLVLAGVERFSIEFIRRNPAALWGLTEAQLVSVAMVLAGGAAMLALELRRRAA